MNLYVSLPLSNEYISLNIMCEGLKNESFIPPVFKYPEKSKENYLKPKYRIYLSTEKISDKFKAQLIYKYKKGVFIHKKNSNVFVQIKKDRVFEQQYLSQIGVSVALLWLLCQENIHTFHAASIVRKKQGFLFIGPSGAGKTTISQYSENKNIVLCDEISAVTYRYKGEKKQWYVFPGPKWGHCTFNPTYYIENSWDDSKDWIYPLNAIFVPFKDEESLNLFNKIQSAQILSSSYYDSRFANQLQWDCRKKVFHDLANLAREIPCYRININLKDDFWEKIDKVVGI